MAQYKVLARDVKWAGKIYFQGGTFTADGEKNIKLADLLVQIGKAELTVAPKPLGRVAETRALATSDLPLEPAPPPPPPAPVPSPPATSPGRYRNRRLTTKG